MPSPQVFKFKKFSLTQEHSALRIGTDAVLLGCSVNLNRTITESGKSESIRILDIGTGCGIILLMLAQKAIEAGYTRIELTGIDIDSGSISDASTNAELFAENFGFAREKSVSTSDSSLKIARFTNGSHNVQINFINISLQNFAKTHTGEYYDIIVSNPPFFINSLRSATDEGKIAKHNDSLPQTDLATGVEKLLVPSGSFYLILPPSEAQMFIHHFAIAPKERNSSDFVLKEKFPKKSMKLKFFIKSIIKFKTTAAKPAKRWVLHFQDNAIAVEKGENKEYEEREMVMMRSNENGKGPAATSSKKEAFTEEYLNFTKDFLLY